MKYFGIILFSVFVLIMNMQNGLHLAIYEVAKPIITKKYCENVDVPEMKCNGKCHMKKILLQEESSKDTNQPVNIPPPEIKFNTLTFFLNTVQKIDLQQQTITSLMFCNTAFLYEDAYRSNLFRPPIQIS